MSAHLRPGLAFVLVLIFVLAIYYQAISHPFSLFDDPAIVDFYGLNSTLSFWDVISPKAGFYFRPVIHLSYWLDYQAWGMEPSFMHLENIVAHLFNLFFVYLIASRLPIASVYPSLPLLSALLFGVHPINSESVNWIAGRTDLYAGVFVLCAIYCLIRAIQSQSKIFVIAAFVIAFLGMLTKETAVMFLPGALLLGFLWPHSNLSPSEQIAWRRRFVFTPVFLVSLLILSVLILVYVMGRGNNAIALIYGYIKPDFFFRSLEAIGFYAKKFILPLPLNIAIVEVHPFYGFVGIICLFLIVLVVVRQKVAGLFLVLSVFFVLPALLIATTSFAWTPFGERYLYIPSALAVIGSLDLTYTLFSKWNIRIYLTPLVCILICIASIITFQRVTLWGDNKALLVDTIKKSPNFGVLRNQYGGVLKMEGRFDEAEKQFKIALQQDNKENVKRAIKNNLLFLKIEGKPFGEARHIILSEIGSKQAADVNLLKVIGQSEEGMLRNAASFDMKKIAADLIETNECLYQKTNDPFYLYKSGQTALLVDDKQKAAQLFYKAYQKSGTQAYYREPARVLAEKLAGK